MEEKYSCSIALIDDAFAKQRKYHSAWSDWDRYYRAKHKEHQKSELKKTGRSGLFIPVIRNVVNITKSIFTSAFFPAGKCPIEILPIGANDKDFARKINKLVAYYYDLSSPQKQLGRAFWSSLVLGMGIVITYWRDGKVITKDIFIKDIAFDPEATDIDDVQYIAYRFTEHENDIRSKFKTKFYKTNKKEILGDGEESENRRFEIKEIIKKDGGKYKCQSFYNGYILREAIFDRSPFQYGYAIDEYKYLDMDDAKDQLMVYGCSLVWMLKEIQDEINIKRNQKNDIVEEIITPTWMVNKEKLTVRPELLRRGAGSHIGVSGDLIPSNIMQRPTPSTENLDADLAMLTKLDLEDASGINGIQRGMTGASDRRSGSMLSVVTANSSGRIEDMVSLMNLTLFSHWAKTFVSLVIKHAPDELVREVLEEDGYPIGKIGKREIKYNINVNFGTTLSTELKVQDILTVVQFLLQSPNVNPKIIEGFIKEFVALKLGDNTNLKELFMEMAQQPVPPPADEVQTPPPIDREMEMLLRGGV